jgi:hypothetical protein
LPVNFAATFFVAAVQSHACGRGSTAGTATANSCNSATPQMFERMVRPAAV